MDRLIDRFHLLFSMRNDEKVFDTVIIIHHIRKSKLCSLDKSCFPILTVRVIIHPSKKDDQSYRKFEKPRFKVSVRGRSRVPRH